MGYGNGIADPMEMMRMGDLGAAQGEARVANARAAEAERVSWEWKNHAEKIKQELKESMRSQWELAHQRDGWKAVAKRLQEKYAPQMSWDELVGIYRELKEEVSRKNPTPPDLM